MKLNNQDVGKLLYAPYKLEITKNLKKGKNVLSIAIKTAQINSFVGRAKAKDKRYKKFKDRPLFSSGLLGPVLLSEK